MGCKDTLRRVMIERRVLARLFLIYESHSSPEDLVTAAVQALLYMLAFGQSFEIVSPNSLIT